MSFCPNRAQALELFLKYNKSEALIRHAKHVSYVMARFARLFGEDPEKWGAVGILHDIDYEMYPEQHCVKAAEILRGAGVSEEYVRAVVSHGYGLASDVAPESYMEKVLFTIDELTGLVYAASLMRPSKSSLDMEYKSVLKKYKAPNFAAGVDRGVIEKGLEMIGKDLEFVITETIEGIREWERESAG